MDYSLLLVTSVLLFVEVCIIIAVSYLIIKKKLLNEVITKRIGPLHQVGLMLTFGILSVLSSYAGVQAEGAIASISILGQECLLQPFIASKTASISLLYSAQSLQSVPSLKDLQFLLVTSSVYYGVLKIA